MTLELTTIISSTVVFLILIFLLVSILLWVKTKLSPSGPAKLTINGSEPIDVETGSTLLNTLGNQKILLPSACGGGGTCAMCTLSNN